MTKNIKMILFDLDGTLLNSMGDFATVAASVLKRYYGVDPEEAIRLYRETSGLPFCFQVEKLFPKHPDNAAAVEAFEEEKLADYFDKDFFEDVLTVLPLLKQKGYQLGVSSNNAESVVLQRIQSIKNYFDIILGYKDGFLKGKDHFDLVKKEFNLQTNELLFVGDSLNDARTAQKNGLAFMARMGTFPKEDFDRLDFCFDKVGNFYEILTLLESETKKLETSDQRLATGE
jgi:HAD superfamily hydrolase (TIGR01549 family)